MYGAFYLFGNYGITLRLHIIIGWSAKPCRLFMKKIGYGAKDFSICVLILKVLAIAYRQ